MPWTSPADQTTGHVVTSTEWNQVVDDLLFLHDKGGDLASAATLPSPVTQYHVVTGTTTITSIPILAAGCRLVLLFTGVCKVTSGGTLLLRSDFGSAVNDTLSLISDGTNWYELGRSNDNARLDYAQVTADVTGITATSEATAAAVITGNSVNCDGTRVKVEVWASHAVATSGSGAMTLMGVLLRDATVLGQWQIDASNASGSSEPMHGAIKAEFFDTPAAGAHVYKFSAFISGGATPNWTLKAGAGGSANLLPAWLCVTRAV